MKRPIILTEIEKYINKVYHNIVLYPVKEIRTLHENLKQVNVLDQQQVTFLNPYHVFSDWLFDVIVNGLLLAIAVNIFITWQGWYNLILIPSLGILRYTIIDLIRDITNAMKGN